MRSYANGAAVMSTMPPMQGGLQPMARTTAFGHVRESIDPDDFTGQLRRLERYVVRRAAPGRPDRRVMLVDRMPSLPHADSA